MCVIWLFIQRSNSNLKSIFSSFFLCLSNVLYIFNATHYCLLCWGSHFSFIARYRNHFPYTLFIFKIYYCFFFVCNRIKNCHEIKWSITYRRIVYWINVIATSWRLHWSCLFDYIKQNYFESFIRFIYQYHIDLNFPQLRKMKYELYRPYEIIWHGFYIYICCLKKSHTFTSAENWLHFMLFAFFFVQFWTLPITFYR